MEIEERIWRAGKIHYLRPFTAATGLGAGCRSRALERILCDFGIERSFEKANAALKEHYGFELNASAVRRTTLKHAARGRRILEKEYAQGFRVLPTKGPEHVVAETDGSMVCTVEAGLARKDKRPREWKEIRLSVAQPLGSTQARHAAGFNDVEEAGRRWGHCVRHAGWALESTIHVVADGAEWIRLQSREVFGDQAHMLVDFYHVSDYLAAAAPTCRPAKPVPWLHTQQRRLKRGAWKLVVDQMTPWLEPADIRDEDAPVRAAVRYLNNRKENLDYPQAIAKGLPIGSGLIESAHKHVLQARLKKAGCAWLKDNAHDIARLRVIRANEEWPQFWNQKAA